MDAATGGRPKLSLRRKKDKDPPTATRKPAENFTLRITPCDSPARLKASTSTVSKATCDQPDANSVAVNEPGLEETMDCCGSSTSVGELLPRGEGGMKGDSDDLPGTQSSVAHPDEGLGDYFFCHICQKDLTRFSASRREQHINRCCDKTEEEERSAHATAKENVMSAFHCVLCEKNFKNEKVRSL